MILEETDSVQIIWIIKFIQPEKAITDKLLSNGLVKYPWPIFINRASHPYCTMASIQLDYWDQLSMCSSRESVIRRMGNFSKSQTGVLLACLVPLIYGCRPDHLPRYIPPSPLSCKPCDNEDSTSSIFSIGKQLSKICKIDFSKTFLTYCLL